MRSIAIAALTAALLVGCSDDDGDESDASTRDGSVDGSVDSSIDAGRDASSLDAGNGRASASLASKSSSNVTGTASFNTVGGVVTLTLSISGASAGQHGVHIHQNGDCASVDGSSAGPHWNPDMRVHGSGAPDAAASSHLGDLGNISIGSDGKGTLTVAKPQWTLGTGAATDVLGHAVVFHANQDDLVTDKSDAGPGMSGARLACGVIDPS